jgi:hypothetical protein
MSRSSIEKAYSSSGELTHVYVNISVAGSAAAGTDPLFRYQETRTNAIVDNPSEWHLSIVRFSVPTADIPLYIVTMRPGQNYPALTNYTVELANGSYTASEPVMWVPVVDVPAPVITNGAQDRKARIGLVSASSTSRAV